MSDVIIKTGISEYDYARVTAALARVTQFAKNETPLALDDAGYNFAREAWARTKTGKPTINAKAVSNVTGKRERGPRRVWTWIRTKDAGWQRLPVPMKTAIELGYTRGMKATKPYYRRAHYKGFRQQVRNRGFARAGWYTVLAALNRSSSRNIGRYRQDYRRDYFEPSAAKNSASVRRTDAAGKEVLEIANFVPPAVLFLDRRDNIMGRAMAATLKNLESWMIHRKEKLMTSWER